MRNGRWCRVACATQNSKGNIPRGGGYMEGDGVGYVGVCRKGRAIHKYMIAWEQSLGSTSSAINIFPSIVTGAICYHAVQNLATGHISAMIRLKLRREQETMRFACFERSFCTCIISHSPYTCPCHACRNSTHEKSYLERPPPSSTEKL